MIQKTNKNIPRRKKYILENMLLNIFKFYILKYQYIVKYIVKFLQSHDNNKKKFDFHNFAEYRLRISVLEKRKLALLLDCERPCNLLRKMRL